MALNRLSTVLAVAMIAPVSQGCLGINERLAAYHQAKSELHQDRQKLIEQELQALRSDLKSEREAIRAQRELDEHCRRAENEKIACAANSQLDESLRTEIGLDFDQRFEVGPLQVNVPEFQSLLEARQNAFAQEMRNFEDAQKSNPNSSTSPFNSNNSFGPVCQCRVPDCAAPEADCADPGHLLCCDRCGYPVTQNESQNDRDCAGTQPFRQALKKPQQKPLLPVEIPLMIPVKVGAGVTNSRLNESQIRKVPYESTMRAFQNREDAKTRRERRKAAKEPCGNCDQCLKGANCRHCVPLPPDCDSPGSTHIAHGTASKKSAESRTSDASVQRNSTQRIENAHREPLALPSASREDDLNNSNTYFPARTRNRSFRDLIEAADSESDADPDENALDELK